MLTARSMDNGCLVPELYEGPTFYGKYAVLDLPSEPVSNAEAIFTHVRIVFGSNFHESKR